MILANEDIVPIISGSGFPGLRIYCMFRCLSCQSDSSARRFQPKESWLRWCFFCFSQHSLWDCRVWSSQEIFQNTSIVTHKLLTHWSSWSLNDSNIMLCDPDEALFFKVSEFLRDRVFLWTDEELTCNSVHWLFIYLFIFVVQPWFRNSSRSRVESG